MITAEFSAEESEGRAAAERLAANWEDRAWVPRDPTPLWARAAVVQLGEILRAQPSMVRASLRGAGKGASTLSPRPFQGLVESLQNADDLGATFLRVAYRRSPQPELLIVHDGAPVTLAHVAAMLLPWLSTKDEDPEASGRFGIGQRTLASLGGPIRLHAPPFHFVMADDGPEPCEPEPDVFPVYEAARRHTLLTIPLAPEVGVEAIAEAVRDLNLECLIFLKSIRALSFRNLGDPAQNLDYCVDISPLATWEITFDGEAASVEVAEIKAAGPADAAERLHYRRYSTRRKPALGERRANKATGSSTPLGVCIPLGVVRSLPLHDRMPLPGRTGLPIGLNAQFDPDSARSELQPNEWNQSRFSDLRRLVVSAALDSFGRGDAACWNHVPLQAEADDAENWTADQVRNLVSECQNDLRDSLRIEAGTGPAAPVDLAYEDLPLEGLLDAVDVKRLRPDRTAMPQASRDAGGRWRRVLGELKCSEIVGLADALEVLDGETDRSPDWYVAFAALSEQHGLATEFSARPSLLLDDGTVTSRPQPHDPWVLVKTASPEALAIRLGLARKLHPAYLAPGASADAFLKRLETVGALFEDRDAVGDVFAVLGRGPSTGPGSADPLKLEDDDLIALRDAWSDLPRDRQSALGGRIGRGVVLKAQWYGADGKVAKGWVRPVEAYLPAAIDREVDSFAKAAGRAPGLKWLDGDYARLLKQPAGRSAIGAQRLLAAWGAAREPRLIKPASERQRWARDVTPASDVGPMQTAEQHRSLRGGGFKHLIDDHCSPDAETVALDIAKAPIKVRRKRAVALLATLARGWERRYSDAATASPANAYNGYWSRGPEIRATWLARLAEVKWMPDAGNGFQRPADLQLQSPGQPPRPSERSTTVARLDSQILRTGLLAALGVKAGPTQRDLVAKLQTMRDRVVGPATADDASALYQLLAASLRDRSDQAPEGRMSSAQLRNAFRAAADGRGLLLVDGVWRSPEQVLGGPALFGARRAFAPNIEGLEALWKVLGVRIPSAADAIAVLREMTALPPTPADLGIAIRAYGLVAAEMEHISPQQRTALRRLPLWTGQAWTLARPIYALEGEALLTSAPADLNVWRPGVTNFSVLAPLLEAFGVVHLAAVDFEPASTPAYGLAEGEPLRPAFARAVSLLKQELVRADQALLDSLSVDWEDLIAAPLIIDPQLSIVAALPSGNICLPAQAHIGREPLRLIARSAADLATADGTGAAVAALFTGDRQKAAWAWAAIWPRAVAGEAANGAVLPKSQPSRGDGRERLEKLARQAAQRAGSKTAPGTKTAPKPGSRPQVQVRKLRELDELEPSVGEIVNAGTTPSGGMVFARRRPAGARVFTPGHKPPDGGDTAKTRTVLPPSSDREQMALDAVQRALRLDVDRFNDLRAARGIGVDAIDELRQCYEIKMSAGAGVPADVTLTASEVEAARNDEDFFLAIVSGLEDGEGQLRVRFIFDPLSRLDVRVRGDLTLTGVDKAEALEFRFSKGGKGG